MRGKQATTIRRILGASVTPSSDFSPRSGDGEDFRARFERLCSKWDSTLTAGIELYWQEVSEFAEFPPVGGFGRRVVGRVRGGRKR